MPKNRQNHTNVVIFSSNGHVNNIQEGMPRLKIVKERSIEYPVREGVEDCIFYLRNGRCNYATNCRFNHPPRPSTQTYQTDRELPQREGEPDCKFFIQTGECKYGPMCKFNHPPERRPEEVSYNKLGLPLRKDEKACSFYLRHQHCKFGAACRFDHPELTPVNSVKAELQVSEATAVGTRSSMPSTGVPHMSAFPGWPWISSYCFPAPQVYMPYYIPAFATPYWNGYLGSMSSMAASNVMGTNLVYTKYPGELTGGQLNLSTLTSNVTGTNFVYTKYPGELIGGQQSLPTMTISNLPERPVQPNCTDFMNNGSCGYGSNCKFHHPKDNIALNLGPHGLPLRPGVDICGQFSSYGMCRYGPTCKFNHPVAGYISGYYYGMPALNQPYFPDPRNLLVSNSTETSHSQSLNITEWIQEPETIGGRNNQHPTTNPEDHLEKIGERIARHQSD